MNKPDEQEKIRSYILGEIGDADRSAIEERIMTDDDYFQKLTMVEEDLMQDYADENLAPADRANFEKCFLISAENRQKVKFARALRKHVNENKILAEPKKKTTFFASLKAFFSTPVPATLGVLIILGFAGFFIWKSFSGSTDSEVLIALNKAYKNDRPTEARITGFNYAPKIEGTRGNNKNEDLNLVFAKSRATEAVLKNETAENLHELGRVYLAEKNFDEAIKQFEKAIKLNPDIAKLHNDLGVALMEKAKTQEEGKLETLAKANGQFTKAIELNKNLLDSYFNRALCLQLIPISQSAIQAWQEYLRLDSDSPWAKEARKYLQKLESQKSQNLSGEDLEKQFFQNFQQKADQQATQLISQTRELITEKYLPQRLAFSYLTTTGEKKNEKLQALRYLAEIEKRQMNDSFASDLADYYADLSDEKIELLKKAQSAVKEGYKFCLEENFTQALNQFYIAKNYFLQAGNTIEADTICEHFIAYCLYNTDKKNEALEIFGQVDKFCLKQQYKWLYVLNLYWLTGWSYENALNKSSTELKQTYKEGLKLSKEMNDSYLTQIFLRALASRSYFVRQRKETLSYLQELFEVSVQPQISIRQKFRNYTTSIEILEANNLQELSKPLLSETLALAEESKDLSFIVHSQINAGIIYAQSDERDNAGQWFDKAEKNAESIRDEAEKKDLLARISLKRGHLERKFDNYAEAALLYENSIRILETMKTPVLLYEAQKSKLLVYQALGNDTEVENQIHPVLTLAEKYRSRILAEQERNSFFDNEQTIYDIATEHNFRAGRIEQAYNYAEFSNSRSLLDWLKKGANLSSDEGNLEVLFNESEKPLEISEIRKKMPSDVQLLQYSVLEDKVFIWLVSKENLAVESSQISSEALKFKVEDFLTSVKDNDAAIQNKGRELYDLLITPILKHLDAKKAICLIPNKVLYQLPFSALVSPNGSYFLSEFSMFYSPSANVFLVGTEIGNQKSGKADEVLLSVGNPKFDTREFKDLPDLTAAEDEARDIAQFYKSPNLKLLIGREADKKSFQNAYKNADIIHFAGHYVVDENSPLLSSLILARAGESREENVLSNSELIGGKLSQTKLVVLSACQTGVEGYFKGEGFVGLSRSFLSSGVPIVIASQWKVDSDAAAVLMKDFHRYRREEKLSSLEALRQAQLDMLNQNKGRFQSPYYWAAFALFGGYAKF
ncbi:hypothetical protein BH20ACI4_BH20ACI4_25900 [soil metagenome]